jgi:hypothetical protein
VCGTPLVNAFAAGAMATVRLNAAIAARKKLFIGLLLDESGGMSGSDTPHMDVCRAENNP